jgi:hypothetical protein
MINCERAKGYAQMLLKLVPNVIGRPGKTGLSGSKPSLAGRRNFETCRGLRVRRSALRLGRKRRRPFAVSDWQVMASFEFAAGTKGQRTRLRREGGQPREATWLIRPGAPRRIGHRGFSSTIQIRLRQPVSSNSAASAYPFS